MSDSQKNVFDINALMKAADGSKAANEEEKPEPQADVPPEPRAPAAPANGSLPPVAGPPTVPPAAPVAQSSAPPASGAQPPQPPPAQSSVGRNSPLSIESLLPQSTAHLDDQAGNSADKLPADQSRNGVRPAPNLLPSDSDGTIAIPSLEQPTDRAEDTDHDIVVPGAVGRNAVGKTRRFSDTVNQAIDRLKEQKPVDGKKQRGSRRSRAEKLLADESAKKEDVINALTQVTEKPTDETFLAILPHIRSRRAGIREAAIRALGRLQEQRCAPALLQSLLDSTRKPERDLAAVALGQCGEIEVIKPLLTYGLLSVSEAPIALESIAQLDEDAAVKQLESIAKESDAEVSELAIQALGKFPTKKSRIAVYNFVVHNDPNIAVAAINAFAAIARPKEAKGLYKSVIDERRPIQIAAMRALIRLANPDNTKAIAKIMDQASDDLEIARLAANVLAATQHEKASRLLCKLAEQDDPEILACVADHLGNQKGTKQGGMSVLNRLAEHADNGVRFRALMALTRLGDNSALPILIRSLDADDITVRRQAMSALGKIEKQQAIKELGLRLLNDKTPEIRQAAARALAKPGRNKAIRLLEKALSDDSLVRKQVYSSLATIGGEEVIPLVVRGLSDAAPEIRVEAINGLVKLNATGEVSALSKLLTDYSDDVKKAAEKAMKTLGGVQLATYKMKNSVTSVRDALVPTGGVSAGFVGGVLAVFLLVGGSLYGLMSLGIFGDSNAPRTPRGKISQIEFAPDGSLAVLTSGGWLEYWDIGSAAEIRKQPNLGASLISFNHAGELLAVISKETETAGQIVRQSDLVQLREGDADAEESAPKVIRADLPSRLLSLQQNKSGTLLTFAKEAVLVPSDGDEATIKPQHPVFGSVFFPDGDLAVFAMKNGSIQAFNLPGGELIATGQLGGKRNMIPTNIALSPDGRWVAAGTNMGVVSIRSLDGFSNPTTWTVAEKTGIRDLKFTPDSKSLVVVDGRPAVTFWDIKTGDSRRLEGFAEEEAENLAISADGKYVAVSSPETDYVTVLDLKDGSHVCDLIVPFEE